MAGAEKATMKEAVEEKDNARRAKYEDFLLSDHKAVSDAHFNTCMSISSFFRYYMLIVSIPLPAVISLSKLEENQSLCSVCRQWGLGLTIMFFLVSFLGTCVMAYISNLRFDAILYARHVNGIRKYFANIAQLTYEQESRYRSLPISTVIPKFFEGRYFLWVIFAFSFFNATYFALGAVTVFSYIMVAQVPLDALPTVSLTDVILLKPLIVSSLLGTWIVVFSANVLLYYFLADWRELKRDFERHIIGVDVDGVLNKHREQFCAVLKDRCNKVVDPRDITTIPVHKCKDIDVQEMDEYKVFNTYEYWSQMPAQEDSAKIIRKLRDSFGFKVYIFTHRDWPQFKLLRDERAEYKDEWRRRGAKSIERITEEWLARHDFHYDKLIIEKGNIHTTAPLKKIRTHNRFVISSKKQIRVFVEDDIEKAHKLANICDLVFLIDQPYNQFEGDLPMNVLRVSTWDELYDTIKRL